MRLTALVIILLFIVPQLAFAANPCVPGTDSNIAKCITQIYQWSLAISAILAMLMMVVGGYLVMTAGGSAQQSEKGKHYIMSAFVGMGLLFGTYIILNTINPDLVDLRDFTAQPPGQETINGPRTP
ncbi:MAG: hypothetical protein HY395_00695 [Candidatus Doudnabacteria bacterium]|nr:hypothetical protein [Candidatus Doudnabacteria bacterium]